MELSPKKIRLTFSLCAALSLAATALVSATATADDEPEPLKIGLSERLGDGVATDLRFRTENGDTVVLRDLIDRPAQRDVMRERGRSRARQFGWDTSALSLRELVEAVR